MKEEGIIVIEPSGPLQQSDFERFSQEIDEYFEAKGILQGLIIYAKSFPGWENFAAFIKHIKFVKEHHKKIKRVAAVTDSKFLTVVPIIAQHFVSAQIRHFDYEDMEIAKKWVQRTT